MDKKEETYLTIDEAEDLIMAHQSGLPLNIIQQEKLKFAYLLIRKQEVANEKDRQKRNAVGKKFIQNKQH